MDQKKQEICLFCATPLPRKNFRDAVKDHCHITGKFCGTAQDACNKKLCINPKTTPIPVVFHNLSGYDAHHLMQAMSQMVRAGELNCIANNMEKYITFSLGNLHFIDSLAFLLSSLDSLVKAAPKDAFKITKNLVHKFGKANQGLDVLSRKVDLPI